MGFGRRDGTDLLLIAVHIDALLHKCPVGKRERRVLEKFRSTDRMQQFAEYWFAVVGILENYTDSSVRVRSDRARPVTSRPRYKVN